MLIKAPKATANRAQEAQQETTKADLLADRTEVIAKTGTEASDERPNRRPELTSEIATSSRLTKPITTILTEQRYEQVESLEVRNR